jgi:hypothetical protein
MLREARGAGADFHGQIESGRWIHIVPCFQPGNANIPDAGVLIYRDAELKQGPPAPTTLYDYHPRWRVFPTAGGAPLRLGTRDRQNFLIGALAEVAVYRKVMQPETIKSHYDAGVRFVQ